jgi:hypothetical protein
VTAIKAVTATVTAVAARAAVDPGHSGRTGLALDTRSSSAADTTRPTGATVTRLRAPGTTVATMTTGSTDAVVSNRPDTAVAGVTTVADRTRVATVTTTSAGRTRSGGVEAVAAVTAVSI